jgi:hypothetical protein
MMAADALRDFISPLLPDWRVQFGRWKDGTKTDRYAVLRQVGGLPAELVRRPHFSLMLIGAEGDSPSVPQERADALIEAMRAGSGDLVFLQPAEPVFWPTNDGRPVFEIAISAITN